MATVPGSTNWYKAVWSGTYGNTPEEIFSYGRHVYAEDTTTPADICTALQDDVTNMLAESTTGSTPFSNLGQVFPSDVHWTLLKVHEINHLTGAMVGESHEVALTDVGLGAEGQGLPYQLTLGITVQAAVPDRKRRNRFYLPRFGNGAVNGHGRVLSTLVDDFQTQLDFQYNANQIADTPTTYFIFSAAAGQGYVIDRWYSGDVIDTQRRRRNKLPEVRHILAA